MVLGFRRQPPGRAKKTFATMKGVVLKVGAVNVDQYKEGPPEELHWQHLENRTESSADPR